MSRLRPAQADVSLAPVAVEAPFYIPATDAPARPRRNLKHNDTFAVFDSHGDIGASAGGEDGLFDCDTRYLSHLELLRFGSPNVTDAGMKTIAELPAPKQLHLIDVPITDAERAPWAPREGEPQAPAYLRKLEALFV